ncbi:MAG: hypothetical protein H6Q20_1506 [Bacteroidetes bacterium]|jgi:hypothetical protein|nr:hypothetical protein [Bacteroidota bacterium]
MDMFLYIHTLVFIFKYNIFYDTGLYYLGRRA